MVRGGAGLRVAWPLVLGYHRITDERETALCVPPSAFRSQLELLLRWGLRPAALDARGAGRFVVTLDDGYADGREEAQPVLDRLRIPATFYVCTAYLTGSRPGTGPAPDGLRDGERFLTDADTRALVEAGHTVASHTVSHRELPRLDDDALAAELGGSKATLEAVLGRPVTDFCYPRGQHDARVRGAVEAAGYERAVVTPTRGGVPDAPLTIERTGIYRRDTPARFRAKVLGLHRWARRWLRP